MDARRTTHVADHRELNDLFWILRRGIAKASYGDLQSLWHELERRLLSHMDVEEQFLFPLVEVSHYSGVERARAEHVRIRGLVCALGLAVEQRAADEVSVRELLAVVHEHAEREDRLLYRLACERASAAVQLCIAETLRVSVRVAHEAAQRAANSSGGRRVMQFSP